MLERSRFKEWPGEKPFSGNQQICKFSSSKCFSTRPNWRSENEIPSFTFICPLFYCYEGLNSLNWLNTRRPSVEQVDTFLLFCPTAELFKWKILIGNICVFYFIYHPSEYICCGFIIHSWFSVSVLFVLLKQVNDTIKRWTQQWVRVFYIQIRATTTQER